ncbi:MAG: hypothetical protein AAGA58_09070 [Verrucomicrobiota bacterium]
MSTFDLSTRAKFALTGEDRIRFLNGQVTNDVKKATTEKAIPACVTNAKGKLDALIHITVAPDGEAFWIDAHASLRETLFTRLDRYIIADDCELTDITDDYQLWHAIGEENSEHDKTLSVESNRLGLNGHDAWSKSPPPWEATDPIEADRLRIDHLIPEWAAEASGDTFPADLGLDEIAVDFHKGCYIGQEFVSRIKLSGKNNRTLGSATFESPPSPGMTLYADEKEVGIVTTAVENTALAVLRRSKASVGLKVVARDPEKPLSIPGEITKTV